MYCGVATISRLLKMIGRFLQDMVSFIGSYTKEIYNFIDPTDSSRPICKIKVYTRNLTFRS